MNSHDFILFVFERIRDRFGRRKHEWWRYRGKKHEELVFAAFERRKNDIDPWPEAPWIKSVRRAYPTDESAGIDAFVITDVGSIKLQIKSSEQYALVFEEEQRKGRYDKSIVVVIINDDGETLEPDDVRALVAARVRRSYERMLKEHLVCLARSCGVNLVLAV